VHVEGFAVDELHGDEHTALGDADVVHRDDVGMGQPRQRLRLSEEALPGLVTSRREDLQGDGAVELGVMRLVHLPHPALAAEADDLEPPEEGACVEGGHLVTHARAC
jgi:hypothetical protein